MAGTFPSEFTPIRIGATVSHGAKMCDGTCGREHAGQPRHMQPNFRFTLLLYMAVIEHTTKEAQEQAPFSGGPFTPPVDVMALQAAPSQAAAQLLRMIGWN